MTAHFSVLEDELSVAVERASFVCYLILYHVLLFLFIFFCLQKIKGEFERNYPPDYVPPVPKEEQAIIISRDNHALTDSGQSKKKRKRSSSIGL